MSVVGPHAILLTLLFVFMTHPAFGADKLGDLNQKAAKAYEADDCSTAIGIYEEILERLEGRHSTYASEVEAALDWCRGKTSRGSRTESHFVGIIKTLPESKNTEDKATDPTKPSTPKNRKPFFDE